MSATGWRAAVKRALPGPLGWLAVRVARYLDHLRVWIRVLVELRGATPTDALRLWLSALAGPVTGLRGLDRWQNPALLVRTRVRVPGVGVFGCEPWADDLFHLLRSPQAAIFRALELHLPEGGTFVDAGANIGVFALAGARRVGPQGRVLAIEMIPATAARLRAHLAGNGCGWVEVVEAALSDRAGETVTARIAEGHAGQASIARSGAGREIAVATDTLDAVTRHLDRVDLMKMDIEGAEAAAFRGGHALLSRTRAVVFEARAEDPGSAEARAEIEAAGFETRPLDRWNLLALRRDAPPAQARS